MDKKGFVITNEESAKEHGFAIPLYTHPVKELPNNHQYIAQLEMTVRNQQAEIEELIKHLEFAGIVVERKVQEK